MYLRGRIIVLYIIIYLMLLTMKKSTVFGFGALCAAVSMFFSVSCSKAVLDDGLKGQAGNQRVTVLTRSATGGLNYPVSIYAFGEDGTLRATQTLESEDGVMSLSLKKGEPHRIVALSAPESDYVLPESPSLAGLITMKRQEGYAGSPLQLGLAEVTPDEGQDELQLPVGYGVTSVEASLTGLPDVCTAVTVTVKSVHTMIRMDGQGSGVTSVTLPCSLSNGVWSTGRVFLFQGTGDRTEFVIAYNDEEGVKSSVVTYVAPLAAGTPYSICGSYSDGKMTVAGRVLASGWDNSQTMSFVFGPELNPEVMFDDNVLVDAIPQAGTVWKGHVVAMSESTGENSASLTLLSLRNVDLVTAAEVVAKANEYIEDGLDGWTVPTRDEAAAIGRMVHSGALTAALREAGAEELLIDDGTGGFVLHLCDEGRTSFRLSDEPGFKPSISKYLYCLRPVRVMKVKLR